MVPPKRKAAEPEETRGRPSLGREKFTTKLPPYQIKFLRKDGHGNELLIRLIDSEIKRQDRAK